MFTFTRTKLFALLAIVAVLGGIVGLSACSGSSQSSGPPTAASVLSSNGYTDDSALTSAVQGSIGSEGAADGLTSLAVGSQGGNYELVMVFNTPSAASTGAAGVQGEYPGVTVQANGDVLTMSGSASTFASLGG